MTAKEMADMLNGSQYGDEITTEEARLAKENGGRIEGGLSKEEMTMEKIELAWEELVEQIKQLCENTEKLKAELVEARLAEEHNRRVAEENQHRCELQYRDGIIYDLKYAIRCNGVSGAEVGL